MSDNKLFQDFCNFIDVNKNHVSAEFIPYCLYQKAEQTYVLIYVDYLESDGIKHNDMPELTTKDGYYLHNQLKKTDLPINYLCIITSYAYTDRKIGSFSSNSIITNEIPEY